VSEASATETYSTWGKMSAAYLVARHGRPLDADAALALHACTGCLRCTQVCAHQNQVAPALFAARSQSATAGVQPPGAAATVRTFTRAGNPFGADLATAVREVPQLPAARPALFPGCTALVKHRAAVDHALAVAAAFGAPLRPSGLAGSCCGYPLYAAGAHDAFRAHARAFAEAAAEVPELVVLDPGCAFTLLRVYPAFEVALSTRVRTLVAVLAEQLARAPTKPPLPLEVAYHDACHLGRGLGEYDGPRVLLARAAATIHEAPSCRDQGGCAGGGGLLPRTLPELSVEVARQQARALGAGPVVTACPTARRMLERAGSPAVDLVELLHRWLEAP
jgi:fumarate reductase (CoM/CoB) subunit B